MVTFDLRDLHHYQEEIWNYWSEFSFMAFATWDNICKKHHVQLLQFLYSYGHAFDDAFRAVHANENGQFHEIVDKMQRQTAALEIDLANNCELANTPFQEWIHTEAFREIVRKYPGFIQDAFSKASNKKYR